MESDWGVFHFYSNTHSFKFFVRDFAALCPPPAWPPHQPSSSQSTWGGVYMPRWPWSQKRTQLPLSRPVHSRSHPAPHRCRNRSRQVWLCLGLAFSCLSLCPGPSLLFYWAWFSPSQILLEQKQKRPQWGVNVRKIIIPPVDNKFDFPECQRPSRPCLFTLSAQLITLPGEGVGRSHAIWQTQCQEDCSRFYSYSEECEVLHPLSNFWDRAAHSHHSKCLRVRSGEGGSTTQANFPRVCTSQGWLNIFQWGKGI